MLVSFWYKYNGCLGAKIAALLKFRGCGLKRKISDHQKARIERSLPAKSSANTILTIIPHVSNYDNPACTA